MEEEVERVDAFATEGLATTRPRRYLAWNCCAGSVNADCFEGMSNLDN